MFQTHFEHLHEIVHDENEFVHLRTVADGRSQFAQTWLAHSAAKTKFI